MYETNRMAQMFAFARASLPALHLAIPMIRVNKRKAKRQQALPRQGIGRYHKQYWLKGIRP